MTFAKDLYIFRFVLFTELLRKSLKLFIIVFCSELFTKSPSVVAIVLYAELSIVVLVSCILLLCIQATRSFNRLFYCRLSTYKGDVYRGR